MPGRACAPGRYRGNGARQVRPNLARGRPAYAAQVIYKLLPTTEWDDARAAGRLTGTAVDHQDGFIHLSGPDQLVATARRHFAGATGL
ncbi:DUF952 domain-containing protein, partial [Micromonospora azadirachtae]